MRFFILLGIILIPFFGVSQNFNFKRVSTDMGNTKMKGTIEFFGDTLLIISSETPVASTSTFDVILESSNNIQKQYYAVFPEGSTSRLRLALINPHPSKSILKKNETGILQYEYVDDFTNISTSMIYYLIPQ